MVHVTPLDLPGLLLLEPRRFNDARGYFSETYRAEWLAAAGFRGDFVQDNMSASANRGTVRGFHFQTPPAAHDKLIRVTRGGILDAVVDLRRGSPAYGRSFAAELTAENGRQLLIPKGFGHALCTLEDDTHVAYKLTGYYAPKAEGGLLWSDPALGIKWPVGVEEAIVSEKDLVLPRLADFDSPFEFEG